MTAEVRSMRIRRQRQVIIYAQGRKNEYSCIT
jgi:hypothetical protein